MTHQLQQCLYWLLLISVYEGNGFLLNVSVNNEGFFLKPIFRGSEIYSLNSLERHFVSHAFYSYHAPSVSLNYGSFSSVHKIPQDVWKAAAKNNSKYLSAVKVVDSDIRVRIVEDAITSEQHELHVVYHAFKQRASQQYAGGNVPDTAGKEGIPSLLCLVTGVENQHTSVASKCSIGKGESHCVTSSNLLQLWHTVGGGSNNVSVWYFAQNVASASQCEDIRQDIESQLRVGYAERAKLESEGLLFLSHIPMVLESPHARRYSVDNKTSFYLAPPQRSLHPGELFSVPVRLQQQLGEWRSFTLRLRARPGVRVVGVESQSKVWQVTASDTAARGDWATVTVKFVGTSQASRVDDIVLWRCQVDPETHDSQSRLMMTVHDVTGGGEGGDSGSKHKKMVLHVDIQRDDIIALVPFIQATDVLNLAVLTGRSVSWPLVIYVVTSAGDIVDVTRDCACLTSSQQIIKVGKQCQSVYVDGSETSGGDGVTVTVRYGRHEAVVSLLVWYPELPLSVEVSDDRLNLIKGWRVPPKRLTGFGDLSESDRYGDWYEDGEMSTLCEPQYQSTVVEVYARFFIVDEYFSPRYFTDRKALLRLTDTLASQLRVTNDYVIGIQDNIVSGKRPGSADVQVVSGSGVVLGKRTVRVVADRVQVEKLQVQLISDVQVEYGIERELSSGSIVFRMNPVSKLTKRYQEGMLDVGVYFSDDTTLPLDYFSPTEYQLVTESADRNVVILSSESTPATPQLIALNPGSGALVKVSLELSKKCQTKKSQALAISLVDVLVDFEEDEQSTVANGRLTEKPLNDAANSYLQSSRYYGEKKTSKKSVARLEDMYARAVDPNYGEAEAQTYEEQDIAGLSPAAKWSSTGMYALLVVFSVATLFFVGNCILFITRCHMRMPTMASPLRNRGEKTTDLQADGWVWLGPETLARNMVNVECSRTLMDERAFNENATGTGSLHGSLPPAYSGSPTTSSRGSAHGSCVSTYKGSECSIRIVSNPLESLGDALATSASTSAERSYCDWERDDLSAGDVAMEFACDRMSLADSQDLHSSASLKSHKNRTSVSSASKVAPAAIAAPTPAIGGGNPIPMDYQELMVYFENLKESVA